MFSDTWSNLNIHGHLHPSYGMNGVKRLRTVFVSVCSAVTTGVTFGPRTCVDGLSHSAWGSSEGPCGTFLSN